VLLILQVTIGRHNLRGSKEGSITLSVAETATHENYARSSAKTNDVMLLLLDAEAPPKFTPVRLPSKMLDLSRAGPLTVMGWGRTGYNERASATQQEVDLDFVSREQCVSKYAMSRVTPITEAMICAGREGADAC